MSGETSITVIGNLVDDPELRFTPAGHPVANFRIASTPRNFDKQTNEWKDGDTLWLGCTVWRAMGENVAESLQKGMRVIVQGNLKSRQYETREGEKRTVFEIDVQEIGPSLKTATAKVAKATNGSGGGHFNGGGQNQSQGQRQQQADPWASPQGNQQQAAPANDPWATPAPAQGAQQGQQQAQGGTPWTAPNPNEEPPF